MKRKEIIERVEDTLRKYKKENNKSETEYGYMYACKHILKLLKNK
jgi:hypothetical protein